MILHTCLVRGGEVYPLYTPAEAFPFYHTSHEPKGNPPLPGSRFVRDASFLEKYLTFKENVKKGIGKLRMINLDYVWPGI